MALWRGYLGTGAALCGLYLFVPPLEGNALLFNLLGISPVFAIAVGLRRYRPASRAPWLLFGVGFLLFWLGDVYTHNYRWVVGHDVPFPSIGDASYVLVYPMLITGLALLVRRRKRQADSDGTIDSLIMTLGLALLVWVALIAPYLRDGELTLLAKAVSVAYPLGDVLLLAGAIRLAVDHGRRPGAFYLIVASIVALLITDFTYGLGILTDTFDHQLRYDAGWIAFYVLWGAAALHPSMRALDEPRPEYETRLTPLRLALLFAASLVAPVIEVWREVRDGDFDLIVVIAASGILFAFVLVRMTGLVRRHERAVERERILSAAGAALVTATTWEQMQRIAIAAIRELAGRDVHVQLCATDETGALVAAARHAVAIPTRSVHPQAAVMLVTGGPAVSGRAVRRALVALASQVTLAYESAELAAEVHRRKGDARMSALVSNSSDLIAVIDAGMVIRYQSPSIEALLGYTADSLVGTTIDGPGNDSQLAEWLPTVAPGETRTFEWAAPHRDGTTRELELRVTNLLENEHVCGYVVNSRDVSERRAFERQLEHQAFHDPVTGLANRALFGEQVRRAVAQARREHRSVAVIVVDLDDFKAINDRLGNAAGDAALALLAERLTGAIRAGDTAARLGGDEFAILLDEVEGPHEAADVAQRIIAALNEPLALEHERIVTGATLGLSVSALAGAEELIRNAGAAMSIAKRDRRGGYRMFEPAMDQGMLDRLNLRADLAGALDASQLELYFQPLVRLADGAICGLEALLRWNHPARGVIPPDAFIPLAEDSGLIVPIGRWVLQEGCRRARAIDILVPAVGPLTMAVNLSVKQLEHGDIVAHVREALEDSGLEPARLTLEITESAMMRDPDLVVARLHELKALGVRLAMDDFGTGYSSLIYLTRMPVDILKMDRSFLSADASPEAATLAGAVVGLGATLSLEVVAEGIEHEEQRVRLRALGCDIGQGYYFSRPMPLAATVEYLRARVPGARALTAPV